MINKMLFGFWPGYPASFYFYSSQALKKEGGAFWGQCDSFSRP
jgi:hypothetical protein